MLLFALGPFFYPFNIGVLRGNLQNSTNANTSMRLIWFEPKVDQLAEVHLKSIRIRLAFAYIRQLYLQPHEIFRTKINKNNVILFFILWIPTLAFILDLIMYIFASSEKSDKTRPCLFGLSTYIYQFVRITKLRKIQKWRKWILPHNPQLCTLYKPEINFHHLCTSSCISSSNISLTEKSLRSHTVNFEDLIRCPIQS